MKTKQWEISHLNIPKCFPRWLLCIHLLLIYFEIRHIFKLYNILLHVSVVLVTPPLLVRVHMQIMKSGERQQPVMGTSWWDFFRGEIIIFLVFVVSSRRLSVQVFNLCPLFRIIQCMKKTCMMHAWSMSMQILWNIYLAWVVQIIEAIRIRNIINKLIWRIC